MHKNHVVVCTFPAHKWDVYGNCLRGFVEHWPKETHCYAVVENPENLPTDFEIPDNVTIIDFDEVVRPRLNDFKERNKDKPIFDMGTTGNIKVQAYKFAHKAYAQLHVLENIDADFIHYLDGDLYTHSKITMEWLEQMTSNDFLVACTPRWWKKKITIKEAFVSKKLGEGYTETGYMIWNKNHSLFDKWTGLYSSMYDKDEIFEYDAWHDCVAWDKATIQCILEDKSSIVDLGYGIRSSHPLVAGPMGKWMDHMKGNRKNIGVSKEIIRMHGDWRDK